MVVVIDEAMSNRACFSKVRDEIKHIKKAYTKRLKTFEDMGEEVVLTWEDEVDIYLMDKITKHTKYLCCFDEAIQFYIAETIFYSLT